MAEKGYPEIEEREGTGMCSEQPVVYAATGSGYAESTYEPEADVPQPPVGKHGFYTEDLDVLEARIADIEDDLDEIEAGHEDPEKWVTSEQFDQALYQQYPWLR